MLAPTETTEAKLPTTMPHINDSYANRARTVPCCLAIAMVALLMLTPLPEAAAAASRDFRIFGKARAMPALRFEGAAGSRTTLEDFRGRLVILNLISRECPVSRRELATLGRLQEITEQGKVTILPATVGPSLAVSKVVQGQEEPGLDRLRVQALVEPEWPRIELGLTGFPTTLFLNAKGLEIGRVAGAVNWTAPEAVALVTRAARTGKIAPAEDYFAIRKVPAIEARAAVMADAGCILP